MLVIYYFRQCNLIFAVKIRQGTVAKRFLQTSKTSGNAGQRVNIFLVSKHRFLYFQHQELRQTSVYHVCIVYESFCLMLDIISWIEIVLYRMYKPVEHLPYHGPNVMFFLSNRSMELQKHHSTY